MPAPAEEPDPTRRQSLERALEYMGLNGGQLIKDIPLDKVFIGSCTNSRIEDLRAAAAVVQGQGSLIRLSWQWSCPVQVVQRQAESEGLNDIFTAAGFEWREPGCSMCLA